MANNLQAWNDVYKNRVPNELEQRLSAQRHTVPRDFQAWVLNGLKAGDPRRQVILRAQMAGQEVNFDDVFKTE